MQKINPSVYLIISKFPFTRTKAYFGRKRDGMHGLVPRRTDAYRFATAEEAEAKAKERLDFFPNEFWDIEILVNPRSRF